MTDRIDYDEFGLFHQNAEEHGLPFDRPPTVRRVFANVGPLDPTSPTSRGRRLSALVWQDRDPQLVLLHGGSQNAHTCSLVTPAGIVPGQHAMAGVRIPPSHNSVFLPRESQGSQVTAVRASPSAATQWPTEAARWLAAAAALPRSPTRAHTARRAIPARTPARTPRAESWNGSIPVGALVSRPTAHVSAVSVMAVICQSQSAPACSR